MCITVSGGSSVYTSSITFTTAACPVICVTPTGLVTSGITTTNAILSWTAANSSYAYLVHYRPVTTPASAWISASTQNSDTIRLTGLTCGTQYEWQVANYCGSGSTSAYTSSITFTTAACPINCVPPTGLVTSNISTTGGTLTWTAASGALAYTVQYRPVTTPAATWTNVTTQTTSISLTTLTCGTQYQWQVSSMCSTVSGGSSVYSTNITFTTLACNVTCVPPTAPVTTNITTTGATLTWTSAVGAYVYMVQYRPVTTPASAWINVTTQTGNSVTLTNLTCGTTYQWQVSTYCGSAISSVYSAIVTFTTLPCASTCVPPGGLVTSNITTTGATLSWTSNATNAYAFLVQYRPVTTPASAWINVTTQTANSITLTGLTCGTTYEWQVSTYCGNGTTSIYSSSITFTTLACQVTCPTPTGLVTSNITISGATLSWNGVSGSYASIVQYRPETTPASAWVNVTTRTSNSVTLTNLTCGTTYQWQVSIYCGN